MNIAKKMLTLQSYTKRKIYDNMKLRLFLYLTILLISALSLRAQSVYDRYLPKKLPNQKDSLRLDKISTETTDYLLEKPVKAEEYMMGPGDVLHLSVFSGMNYEWSIVVSPEGKAVVPGVASFDLNNKTLKQAEEMIVERVGKKFKADEISLTLKKIRKFKVMVSGEVVKSMSVSASATDRVSDAISKAGGFKSTASLRYINLIRDGKTIFVDLLKYYQIGDESQNPTLMGGDFINVYQRNESEYIKAEGELFAPDVYEYVEGDSLSTLIKLAQGFKQSAFLDSVEFVRLKQSSIESEFQVIDLNKWHAYLSGKGSKDGLIDFPLLPGDKLFIRKKYNWQKDKYVILEGEVKYPGHYAISENKTTLKEIIEKAGGFTDDASRDNAILIRQSIAKEQDLDMVRLRTLPPSEMSESERKYYVARSSEIPGRISVDFNKLMSSAETENNVLLWDQDSLYIPKLNSFINVGGRVNNPGRIAYNPNYTYEDYINIAGGYGYRADESATVVVKSKGQQYLAKKKNYTLEPGDNIFVYAESELTFFEIFTTTLTIVTQLLTIVAVVFTVMNSNKK